MDCLPNHSKHTRTILALSLGLLVLLARPVWAQVANMDEIQEASVGLTAIPPRLGDGGELTADPGETIQTQVRVRNSTNKPIQVGTIVEDFIIGEDGRTPTPVSGQNDSRWSLAHWMELSNTDQVVAPGASETINVVIRVPDDALPGGRYAMIMHRPKLVSEKDAEAGSTAGQTGIDQRVGTLVYLRVAGDVKEEAFLRNIKVPHFLEFGPVPIKFSVENLSDIHIQPIATITIRDMFGLEKAKVNVPPQNVFPYTMREFSSEWDRVWGLGRYSAEIAVKYGFSNNVITETVYFWLIPVKLILAILTIILALIGVAVAIRRHMQHRSGVEAKHIALLEERIQQLESEIEDRHE